MTRENRSRQKTEERKGDSQSEPTFPIVGIGASAGGLKALQMLFDAIGKKLGAAFVVILHLAPDLESNLAEVLQKYTTMPVSQVTRKTKIQPDHVCVIPPNRSLAIAGSHLLVSAFTSTLERRKPIDHFFRSLAATAHDVIGIILSGSGADGTVGIKAINEHGGIVIVQSPSEAEHDSMPRSAIATHLVDLILPAGQIAEKLIEYKEVKKQIRLPSLAEDVHQDEHHELQQILTLLRSQTGHDFSRYKRPTVLRRIGRRMQVYHLKTIKDYLDFLRENKEEGTALLQELLISVTSFFRDPASWQALRKQVLPQLFANQKTTGQIRAWVAGCATGEEAYSLAMLLLELVDELNEVPAIQILATDIDAAALRFARTGRYPEAIEVDVSKTRLRRFFHKKGLHYQVREEVRELIVFTTHNLLEDPPFSQIDLITCRNLFIYFDWDLQQSACDIFHYSLKQNGFLFLGSAEGIKDGHKLFEPVSTKHSIFRSVSSSKTPLPVKFSVHQQQNDFSEVREQPSKNRRSADLMHQYHRETCQQ